jgi:thiamine biosynthesis lipoprotein
VSASASFRALGTTATIAVVVAEALEDACACLESQLVQLDKACSRFRADSELTHANARAGHTVEIGPILGQAVEVALAAAASTGGLVSPTVGTALACAGYDRTFELVRLRDGWTIHQSAAVSIDAWREVELNVVAGTLRVPRGVELDLGATAKSLAADQAAAEIAEGVGCGVLVSLGGDIAVGGTPPPGGWVVQIADDHGAPRVGDPMIAVSSGGIATSSTIVRRWQTDRGTAHHIVDPRTSVPVATFWRTVSVSATSCVDANAAALGAMMLGREAPEWIGARGLHARLVRHDGMIAYAGAWPAEAEAA